MRFLVKICLYFALFFIPFSYAEEEYNPNDQVPQESEAPAPAPVKKSYINTKVFEDEEEPPRMNQEALQGMNQEFQDAHKNTQFQTQMCKAQNQYQKCPPGSFFDVTSCQCVKYSDEIGGEEWDEKASKQKLQTTDESFVQRSNPSPTQSPPQSSTNPPISNQTMQSYLQECAQASVDAENTCDSDKNEDTSGFASGLSRLQNMLARNGGGSSAGGCALMGAVGVTAGGIFGGAKAECFSAKASCESACARAKSYLAEYSNFTSLVMDYSKRCEKIKDVSQSLVNSAAGMGSIVAQSNNCIKALKPSDDCLKNPIKCAFGNSSCKTEADRRNNPTCYCQSVNPNDPMCALLGQVEDSSSATSNNVSLSSKLNDAGASLPLSRVPTSSEESTNPAEELLANHHPQPIGNIELQGKSGDGLGGGGGSVLGSSQKPGGSAGKAGSSISTKINAGFLAASSFGLPTVTGKESSIKQEKRFKHYRKGLRSMYPRMSAMAALAMAHRLALRDVSEWMRLQDALNQGQTEEKLIPLKAVLANETLYMDENKTVSASDFISKKQNPEEKEKSLWESFHETIIECVFFLVHWDEYPLNAAVSLFFLSCLSFFTSASSLLIYKKLYLNSPAVKRRKKNYETFEGYLDLLSEKDQERLLEIDFEKIGGFSVLYTYMYLKNLKDGLEVLNKSFRKNGLSNEHEYIEFDRNVLLGCLFNEGQKDPEATGFIPMFFQKNERRLNYYLVYYGLVDEMKWKYQKPISPEALLKTYGKNQRRLKQAG